MRMRRIWAHVRMRVRVVQLQRGAIQPTFVQANGEPTMESSMTMLQESRSREGMQEQPVRYVADKYIGVVAYDIHVVAERVGVSKQVAALSEF